MEEIHYIYWLANILGIGAIKAGKLIDYFGNAYEVYRANLSELIFVDGINENDANNIINSRNEEKIISSYNKIIKNGIHITYKGAENYPIRLNNIYNAPFCLYYKGQLPENDKPSVAIVGARDASYEGMELAKKFGHELAGYGVNIISGLARGVDISSQRGAMSVAGGRTYGIMGCGIDICYPRQHIEEYMLIQNYGGIISEYGLGVKAFAGNFPMRNRIISGLADGILVIEAREKSGSLITAETGIEQGKDVFAVPGGIRNPLYSGSNKLIKQGAALVTEAIDVLDALGIFYNEGVDNKKTKNTDMLNVSEKLIYNALGLEPAHISEIAQRTDFNLQQTMEILISLEMKKLICMVGNNYYTIRL